ncbi:MAG: hypothetical protein ACYS8S_04600 [Planctomycetota bacterium]|jgi:hypothetical protein
MKKQHEHHIISNIDSFDQEASIYKILFQDRTTSLLKHVIDKISIDRYEQVNIKLPSILIAGENGKQLIARAFSNSTCNRFEFIQGRGLNMGGCSGSLLENSKSETTYYINQSDKLTPYSVSHFYKFLTKGFVEFRDHMRGRDLTISAENKLFIFGTDDPSKLCPDLAKAIDYHCSLKSYSTEELEILVEMRLRWAGLDFEKEVPAIIVHNSQGSISNCVRLMSVCFLVMRGTGNTMMSVKDCEIGIRLNQSQGRFVPPSIPGDISC